MQPNDGPRDAIRMPNVTIGFLEGPPSPLGRFWPFRRLDRPDPHREIDELDEIFVWHLLHGEQLYESLYRLGLGPNPEDVFLPEDSPPAASRAYDAPNGVGVLPSEFADLLNFWLSARKGRRLWLKIRDLETTTATLAEAEHWLMSASF